MNLQKLGIRYGSMMLVALVSAVIYMFFAGADFVNAFMIALVGLTFSFGVFAYLMKDKETIVMVILLILTLILLIKVIYFP